MSRLERTFYLQSVETVAKQLLGKQLVRVFDDETVERYVITETEAYCGVEDRACHASKGRTKRTEVMFHEGGKVYMYLIYGMYWMLNIVCEQEGNACAVLIRGVRGASGPGRVGRVMELDKSFYGEDLTTSQQIWIEDTGYVPQINASPRVGIDYAGEPWVSMPLRFYF
ncbi:DNA-3-methyladenine glycosylase [Puteibacter caeruleilacunae]|nr:DNA-3-methyladenine glycosylase [Puteibacter caeruleilacunae]